MTQFKLNRKKPVVYFGRITEAKGVKLIIQVMHTLYKEEYSNLSPLWIIGGNYSEIKKLKEQIDILTIIQEMESNNLLFWWGHVPHDILPHLLTRCSVFCFASLYEPGGRTILEAMACGLPVIATPQGFAPEIINEGVNGFIVNDNSIEKWKEKICFLLTNEEAALEMGSAARMTIKNNFTMNHFFSQHWDIYQQFQPRIK
ncbi:MAG: glycosyltransferase family 4 protein [Saprospiraceae bacterium]|nr:glycosyltransferase family 4 protein [Saprospiraceae bacterium]